MHPLSQPRFEALLYRRVPWATNVAREVEWWRNADESLIATINLDFSDRDYAWIILGRDETGVFRAVYLDSSYLQIEDAREAMRLRMSELSSDHAQEFPQGDNDKRKQEILVPCEPELRLHPNFVHLTERADHSPAYGLLRELSFAFKDRDGNFRKDFQTTGFDGRLWELFLYAFLYEQKFQIDDKNAIPDFLVEKGGCRLAIEATTVNPTNGIEPPIPRTAQEETELCRNYMPIKWGSALLSKLRKKYWEKEKVAGLPLIFAIHDFHGPGSMTWSLPALSDYLYGVRCDGNGDDQPVDSHRYGSKTIPSGFFSQPDAENVAAVLASNEATLAKFNRMGKIAGFGDPKISMARIGVLLRSDPPQREPFTLPIEIGVASEDWSSGIWVFHNPNAKSPLKADFFEGSLNVFFHDGHRDYFSTKSSRVLRSYTAIKGTT